jgi:hypothetical protein
MRIVAHHGGEGSLAPLLLLLAGGGGLSLLAAVGRAELAAALDRLMRIIRRG